MHYQFIQTLSNLPFVKAIYLYGSRARGDNQARSDIDLAISCPDATEQEWQQIMTIIEEADTLLKIDCVRLDKLDNHELLSNIEKEKKILFERDIT